MKNIKRIFATISLILFCFIIIDKSPKSYADDGWMQVSTSPTKIKTVITSDLFVAEDYSNVLDGIPSGDNPTFYVTQFMKIDSGLTGLQVKWAFASDEVQSITSLSSANGTEESAVDTELNNAIAMSFGPLNITYGQLYTNKSYSTYWSYASDTHGHTGTGLEGSATDFIKNGGLAPHGAGTSSTLATIDTTRLNYVLTGNCGSGTYLLSKFKVVLKSGVTSFNMTCTDYVQGGADGIVQLNSPTKAKVLSISFGGGSLSKDNSASVSVYKSGATTASSSHTFSSTSSEKTLTVPADASTADILITPASNATIVSGSVSGATLNGSKYSCSVPAYSASPNYTTVKFKIQAQDTEVAPIEYTLNIQREASTTKKLDSLVISKIDGTKAPMITTSATQPTSYSPTLPAYNANSTYYIWLSSTQTGVKVNATYTANKATMPTDSISYTSGNDLTVLKSSYSQFVLKLYDEKGDSASYTFVFKQFADGTALTNATTTATDSGTSTFDSSGVANVYIPYGKPTTSTTLQITPANSNTTISVKDGAAFGTLGSLFTHEISIDSYSGTDPTISGQTTVLITVTDTITGDTKDYTINVYRKADESKRDLNSLTITYLDGTKEVMITTSPTEPSSYSDTRPPWGAGSTYYIWLMSNQTGVNVTAVYDAASAKLAGSDYTSNTTKAIYSSSNGTFKLILTSLDTHTSEYTFVFKTYTDCSIASDVSTSLSTSTDSLQTSNPATITIPYSTDSTATIKVKIDNTIHTKVTNVSGTSLGSGDVITVNSGYITLPVDITSSSNTSLSGEGTAVFKVTDTITGKYQSYVVDVIRQKDSRSDDAKINSIVVSYDGVSNASQSGTSPDFTLVDKVPYAINKVNVKVSLSDSNASFTIKCAYKTESGSNINGTNNHDHSLTIGTASDKESYDFVITIVVTPENQDSADAKTYTIKGTRIAAETDNTLDTSSIVVINNTNGGSDTISGSWTKEYYDLGTLAYSVKSLGISVDMSGSLATMKIDGSTATNGQVVTHTIASTTSAITNQTVSIIVTAEDGTPKTYYVRYSRSAPSAKAEVENIYLKDPDDSDKDYSVTLDESASTTSKKVYKVSVPFTVNNLNLNLSGISANATVYYDTETSPWTNYSDFTNGYKACTVGTSTDVTELTKTFTFKIEPESGSTGTITYNIIVSREKADDESGLEFKVTGVNSSPAITYVPYTPATGSIAGTTYYSVKSSDDTQVRIVPTLKSSKATLKFSTDASTWTDWTSQDNIEARDIDATYYFKVITEASPSGVQYNVRIDKADERSSVSTLKEFYITDSEGNRINNDYITSDTFTADEAADSTHSKGKITITVPYACGDLTVVATPTDNNADKNMYKNTSGTQQSMTIEVSKIGSGLTKTYDYFVKAENQTYCKYSYQIEVTRTAGNNTFGLKSLTVNGTTVKDTLTGADYTEEIIDGLTVSGATRTYYINLARSYNGTSPTISAIISDSIGNAKVGTIESITLEAGKNNQIVFYGYSEAYDYTTLVGLKVKYTINIYVSSEDKTLNDFWLLDAEASDIQSSSGVQYPNNYISLEDEDGQVVFTYTNQTSNSVTANINYANRNIFFSINFDPTVLNAKIFVKRKGQTYWDLASSFINTTLTLNNGSNIYEFVIMSEFEFLFGNYPVLGNGQYNLGTQTDTYKFELNLNEVNTYDKIIALEGTIGGVSISDPADITIDQNNNVIIIQNLSNYSSSKTLWIKATKEDASVKVIMPGKTEDNVEYTTILESEVYPFSILCYSEASTTPRIYSVKCYAGKYDLATNNDVSEITVSNSDVYYQGLPTGTSENNPKPVDNIPAGVSSVKVKISLVSSLAKANLYVKEPGSSTFTQYTLDAANYATITATLSATADVSYVLKIYGTSSEGVDNTLVYYLELVFPKASNDTTGTISSPGSTSNITTDPTSTDTIYIEAEPNTTDLPLEITPTDSDAKVTVNAGTLTWDADPSNSNKGTLKGLQTGLNKIKYTITAPGGGYTVYTTYIWVDENPQLDDLQVIDETATDEADKYLALDPSFTSGNGGTYTVKIPYSLNSVTLKYLLPTTTNKNLLNVVYTLDGSSVEYSFYNAYEADIHTQSTVTVLISIGQKYTYGTGTNPIAASMMTYTVKLEKAEASNECELVTISNDGNSVNGSAGYTQGTTYELEFTRTTSYAILNEITYKGASMSISADKNANITPTSSTSPYAYKVELKEGKVVTVTITITSESGKPKEYYFALIACDTDYEIKDLKLYDQNDIFEDTNGDSLSYADGTNSYPISTTYYSVKNTTTSLVLKIYKPTYSYVSIIGYVKNDSYETSCYEYTINLTNYVDPTMLELKVQILSERYVEYKQEEDYASDIITINLMRQNLDTDATLKYLRVYASSDKDKEYFTTSTPSGTYIMDQIGDVTQVKIFAEANKSSSTISPGSTGTGSTWEYVYSLSTLATDGYHYVFTITVTAEDGTTTQTYTIELARDTFNMNDNNTLNGLQVFDSNNVYYIDNVTNGDALVYDKDITTPYEVTIPYGATSYIIQLTTAVPSSFGYIQLVDGSYVQTSLRNFAITSDMYGKTYTHEVYVKSQSGIEGTHYTVKVTLEEPDDDNHLFDLSVDGEDLVVGENIVYAGASYPDPTFIIEKPYTKTSSLIYANLPTDSTAKILDSSNLGTVNLAEGANYFFVKVQAQNGDTEVYTIIINRAYADPTLFDLSVLGQTLLDENGLAVEFDPETNEYYVTVTYTTETAKILYKKKDVNDEVFGAGIQNLAVGENDFTVEVVSINGGSTEYVLHITRLPEETMNANLKEVTIDQIDGKGNTLGSLADNTDSTNNFNDSFSYDKIYYGVYNVDNKTSSLNVNAKAFVEGGLYGSATVEIKGADSLDIGSNNVVILVTAADGVTQKAYVIEVNREDISYEVLEEKITNDGYTIEKVKENEEYKINIGKAKTSDVDYLSYINIINPETQDVKVDYRFDISDNPDEVIVQITTEDGITREVTFHIESTGNPSNISWQDLLPLLILLLVVIILLIIILISVNKDKYGKITRKADKKSDKKQKETAKK